MDTLNKIINWFTDGSSNKLSYHYFSRKFTPMAFIGPALLVMAILLVFPLLFSFKLSFQQWHMIEQASPFWIGLDNYFELLANKQFWNSFGLQLLFVVVAVSFELLIGLLVAVLLNREFPGNKIIRALLLLPIFILPVVSGLTFRFMYNPQYGAINYFLKLIGFNSIAWLSHPETAFAAIIIQDIWRMWPFMFMILFAGLSSLPEEPYEAAIIDGASRWRTFLHITLPLLKPTIMTAIILRTVDALKAFSEIFVMTSGGPGNATTLLSVHIYKSAFKFWELGYSAASSYMLVFIAMIFTVLLVRNMFSE